MADQRVLAAALRGLAALLRAGFTLPNAIERWQAVAPSRLQMIIGAAARRTRLGAPPSRALASFADAMGEEGHLLIGVVESHTRTGCDLSRQLDKLAEELCERDRAGGEARAAAAGARLSGRMVAALPLLCLPLLPASRDAFSDTTGLVLALAGLGFGVGGIVWMERLVPRPPQADPSAGVAVMVAASIEAGLDVQGAFAVASASCGSSLRSEFHRANRLVALGLPWPRALVLTKEEGLREIGSALEAPLEFGAPAVAALREVARARRIRARLAFNEANRRAPVWMVLPLVLCILPAFILLGIAPFLRQVAGGA